MGCAVQPSSSEVSSDEVEIAIHRTTIGLYTITCSTGPEGHTDNDTSTDIQAGPAYTRIAQFQATSHRRTRRVCMCGVDGTRVE
jgi:hypothetical protein